MNYRHAFHAGNFADVVKHATLALVIEHLKLKPSAFCVVDTHAGAGSYDLTASEAQRTAEWRDGIGRLLGPAALPLSDDVAALLRSYSSAIAAHDPGSQLVRYPGSPLIALALLRPDDRLAANELHPDDALSLKAALGRDPRARLLSIDGWQALKSLLPPKERRGVILVDPPFEEAGELDRLLAGLGAAVRRFATGTYLLWFPIKNVAAITRFKTALTATQYPKLLVAELWVRAHDPAGKLGGTGLAILNPPFSLEAQLRVLLPFLAERLAQGPGAGWRLDWLSGARR